MTMFAISGNVFGDSIRNLGIYKNNIIEDNDIKITDFKRSLK